MKRADLYLMNTPSSSDQVDFCCRLCEKALEEYPRIFIQTTQSTQNEALDSALWTFKAESFLPHEVGQSAHQPAPILIDNQPMADALFLQKNLLVVLEPKLPENTDKYQRLCLIIRNNEHEIQDARRLYKQLKNQNIEVHIHDRR